MDGTFYNPVTLRMTTRQTFTEDMVGDWSMRSSQRRLGSRNKESRVRLRNRNVFEIVPMQVLHGCVARLGRDGLRARLAELMAAPFSTHAILFGSGFYFSSWTSLCGMLLNSEHASSRPDVEPAH